MKNLTSTSKQLIHEDIENWLINYIEVNNEFYDYKFPPCPFARTARLKGLVRIEAYTGGGLKKFVRQITQEVINNKQHQVCIITFPAYYKWLFTIKWFIRALNQQIIPQDYYAQYGIALHTSSRYPGILSGKPYFTVVVNQLSVVLKGHKSLLNTDYYKSWDDYHYDAVVARRQQLYEQYSKSSS